jgi:DNA-binding NarL/FixJ family response regulator
VTIRLVLLDDEELVRGGIRLILEAGGEIEVVAEGGDGADAVDLVSRHRPDLLLTDIQMPRVDGLEVVRRVTALSSPPPVVMLTTFDLDEYVYTALQLGASGFLLKDTPPRELAHAVRVVVEGEAMLSPRITKRLLTTFAGGSAASRNTARARLDSLTPREREVALAVAEGHSNDEIAKHLAMSLSTVKVHLGRVMSKVQAANRTQVAIIVHDAT